jgi:Predicted membrane protein (DUF2339)
VQPQLPLQAVGRHRLTFWAGVCFRAFRSLAISPRPYRQARVPGPSPLLGHMPSPGPTLRQRLKNVSSIEETLGTNWLNKLGIIILVVGVALFGIYELQALGPAGKVGISYAAALAFLAGGMFLEKKKAYHLLGRTGIGGGWALLFFTTYVINHVNAMRVLRSESVDLVLMLLVALSMAWHTLQYRSQFVTGLAFLLGYGTVSQPRQRLQPVGRRGTGGGPGGHRPQDGLVRTRGVRDPFELSEPLVLALPRAGDPRGRRAAKGPVKAGPVAIRFDSVHLQDQIGERSHELLRQRLDRLAAHGRSGAVHAEGAVRGMKSGDARRVPTRPCPGVAPCKVIEIHGLRAHRMFSRRGRRTHDR